MTRRFHWGASRRRQLFVVVLLATSAAVTAGVLYRMNHVR
jgi:hypothetical protein